MSAPHSKGRQLIGVAKVLSRIRGTPWLWAALANYFPNDDDTQPPRATWRSHANLLYQNWLNYFVYQETPYDLHSIGNG